MCVDSEILARIERQITDLQPREPPRALVEFLMAKKSLKNRTGYKKPAVPFRLSGCTPRMPLLSWGRLMALSLSRLATTVATAKGRPENVWWFLTGGTDRV